MSDAIRAVRKCPSHRVVLVEKFGAPYCPWQAGHFPDNWIEVDAAGREVLSQAGNTDDAVRHSWRQGVEAESAQRRQARELAMTLKPPPVARPVARPAVTPASARAAVAPRPTTPPPTPPAREPALERGDTVMPVRKCSRCGGKGHNKQTCSRDREAAAAEPSASRTAPARRRQARVLGQASTALARSAPPAAAALELASTRPELQQLRDQLNAQIDEVNHAIETFDLVEKQIPSEWIDAARQVLEAAGADFTANGDGRQRLALNVAVAGVAAAYYAATPPKRPRRQEILYAAAAAISGLVSRKES